MTPSFLIELPLRPRWECVEQLRQAALVCLETVSSDRDFREQLAMIAGELLENALKYGDWSGPETLARVSVQGSAGELRVTVRHAIPDGADLSRLERTLERIHSAASAEQAYVDLLRDAALRPQGTGGLGLARIAYEGNCRLSLSRPDARTLEIVAVIGARRAEPAVRTASPG